ncbi:hypothetical protein [Pedobacter hiemivivus]|uniref:Uncharacterized protein n=1 Tax=Pedobacter hiemivivus TaxID=2530454 RepID=A0A4R0NGE2_9SPHI|nr:hypothetical protein [Pedobacter hiemivivus]TCC98322.1 hypothetical protein EZ444_03275 [Pedobacter hiemivivus]
MTWQNSIRDSLLSFDLEVSKVGTSTSIIDEGIEIDLKGKKYINSIYQTLQEKSVSSKYDDLTIQQIKDLCLSIRALIDETIKPLTPEQIKNPEIQGMYMSLAFARRILQNKLAKSNPRISISARKSSLSSTTYRNMSQNFEQPIYAQDVYEGYELGLSSFVFNEDIIVNKQEFLNVVNADANNLAVDDQGLYVFQYVLNNTTTNSLSLKDLLVEIDNYVASHPENIDSSGSSCLGGWWPSGSSHGCCGNYSGCCWFWRSSCYIHDKICTKCKPKWFCLPGCISDPDYESNGSPFTFIEDNTENESLGDVTLVHTFSTEEDVEDLDTDIMIYCATILEIKYGIIDSQVPIFLNNQKFYTSSSFTDLVSDGYYKFDIHNNNNNYIVNSKVIAIYQWTP